jgi:hypothetical protein
MWPRITRALHAAVGDDGTGAFWPRLTPDGREVMRLAFIEARAIGHPCMADEHLLLGLLRHGTSPAAVLLQVCGAERTKSRVVECPRTMRTIHPPQSG